MNISLHDEVETRFPLKSFGGIKDMLLDLGAYRAWHGIEEIRYFDTSDCRLRDKGERIRVKMRKGESASLQCKSFLPDIELGDKRYKVRVESEVIRCESFEDARRRAKKLWRPDIEEVKEWRYRKRRQHWVLGDIAVIELDTLVDLNGEKYIEIESDVDNINRIVERLELDWSFAITEGYRHEHIRKRVVA